MCLSELSSTFSYIVIRVMVKWFEGNVFWSVCTIVHRCERCWFALLYVTLSGLAVDSLNVSFSGLLDCPSAPCFSVNHRQRDWCHLADPVSQTVSTVLGKFRFPLLY